MAKENKNLIVALDIGTSKVACLVAELAPDGTLAMLGMGSHESKGLKKGVVVNIEATVAAIQRALEEAELMADCKIASAYVGIAGNHIRSFNSTGMVAVKDREVSALDVNRALDTARAVLSEDEKDLGVCLLDIGGGTTDIAVFTHGAIRHTAVIPIAGDQITNDIAMALRTPTADAESIKIRHGVVLTGGSAVMQGMVELGEEIFHMPVRVGVPRYAGTLAEVLRAPRHATGVGLLYEGVAQMEQGKLSRQSGSVKAVLGRMREWFQRNFEKGKEKNMFEIV